MILRFNESIRPIPPDAGEPPKDAIAYRFPADGQSGGWIMLYREVNRLRSAGADVWYLVEGDSER